MKAKVMLYSENIKSKFSIVLYRRLLITGVFLILFIVLILFLSPGIVSAENRVKKAKVVTSVQIAQGDSLWSLAKRFYTAECGKFSDYVEEIKNCNGMSSDMLYMGSYIIIPYYTDESI